VSLVLLPTRFASLIYFLESTSNLNNTSVTGSPCAWISIIEFNIMKKLSPSSLILSISKTAWGQWRWYVLNSRNSTTDSSPQIRGSAKHALNKAQALLRTVSDVVDFACSRRASRLSRTVHCKGLFLRFSSSKFEKSSWEMIFNVAKIQANGGSNTLPWYANRSRVLWAPILKCLAKAMRRHAGLSRWKILSITSIQTASKIEALVAASRKWYRPSDAT
jgi:hypothetical protein